MMKLVGGKISEEKLTLETVKHETNEKIFELANLHSITEKEVVVRLYRELLNRPKLASEEARSMLMDYLENLIFENAKNEIIERIHQHFESHEGNKENAFFAVKKALLMNPKSAGEATYGALEHFSKEHAVEIKSAINQMFHELAVELFQHIGKPILKEKPFFKRFKSRH
ncbi:MAG: hypothetical protein ABIA76_00655 [Candidatus Diapherotrites archaeon]